ncbi:MAG: hypothetical protein AAGA22_07870, partial [Pseudomonadota bacterium]
KSTESLYLASIQTGRTGGDLLVIPKVASYWTPYLMTKLSQCETSQATLFLAIVLGWVVPANLWGTEDRV